MPSSGETSRRRSATGSRGSRDEARSPRILYSGRLPRYPGRRDRDCACAQGDASDPAAATLSGLHDTSGGSVSSGSSSYDCDCGLFMARPGSYDCDCGLYVDSSASYDCDCGLFLDGADTYDCDCGLLLDAAIQPAMPEAPALWAVQHAGTPVALEGGWRAYWNPLGPVGVTTLNPEAQRILAAFESPVTPEQAAERLSGMPAGEVRRTVKGLAQIGLLQAVDGSPSAPSPPSTLSAWLHVTEACNLNCPYCYVQKRPQTMSASVGRRAVDKLVETAVRHGYRALKLKYAGGEPTLCFSVIQAVHAHAVRRTTQAGLALEGVVLTNGVGVTDETLDFLAQSGLRLMVSLDGGPHAHDRLRAGRDGGSTHAAVAGTVERALDRGLRPTISITLTAINLQGAVEAAAFALDRGLPFSLNFYRVSMPGADHLPPLVPDLDPLVRAVHQVYDLIRLYPAYPLSLAGILDRTRLDIPHDTACSAGRDYLAVNTGGQLSACQMLLEDPWACLDDDDPLDLIQKSGEATFGAAPGDSDCRSCQWRTACGGGCPLLRDTALQAHYCQAYQALLPGLVRLEAGRLIAIHSAQPSSAF